MTASPGRQHRAHSALHDARRAAHLLSYYLAAAGSPPPWTAAIRAAGNRRWPAIATEQVTPVHRQSPGQRDEHFLTRLVDRLPRLHQPQGDAYLALLDRALLDRHISASEADGLVATADTFGLARADVLHLHRVYLDGLAVAACDDGILTAKERHDLNQVAGLLGLQAADVEQALAAAETERRSERQRPDAWQLRPGDIVVFTGAMQPPREEWQSDAVAAGLRAEDHVTTRTKLLVAADPDSMSGKAKKARQYGIPIVHTSAYLNMLATLRVPTQAGRT
jgi:DNA polymerase III subunit epsilon